MHKKGLYFTVDAIIAVSILFITLMLITQFHLSKRDSSTSSRASSDIVRIFTETKVGEVENGYVKQLIANGTITKTNNSIFEQLGEFWAEGEYDLAQKFIANLSKDLVRQQFGMMVAVDGETMYSNNKSLTTVLSSSKKIISGIAKDKPTDGFTSKAHLTSINQKKLSSFAYFGGFVGQGNITVLLESIGADVEVQEMFLELDAADSFLLFINDVQCMGTFTPINREMSAERWNVSSCASPINPGQKNNISIKFPNSIQTSSVGGGLMEVVYTTDKLQEGNNSPIKTEWLPAISGVINLYSSLYVPGTLNHMDIHLHYHVSKSNESNYTLYLSLGNQTVILVKNAGDEGIVTINDSNLTMLSYPDFSQKTIPLRLGFENVSFVSISSGNGDVALITDVSGSMVWRMDADGVNGVLRNCDHAQFNNPDTRRISVAKCLDFQFVLDILNISGNKVGLISFDDTTEAANTVYPTTNTSKLNQTIGTSVPQTGYAAGGGTCICCGINSATQILTSAVRNKTMIGKGGAWLFTNRSLHGEPAPDPSGNKWYDLEYSNESDWLYGSGVIGATNGYAYSPSVNTEMGADFDGSSLAADLWEHGNDADGPPNDFSSNILNSTANTYGIGGENDGWDWDMRDGSGPFGSDDDIDYNGATGQKIQFDNNFGGGGNTCSSRDCSGAYGILINITPQMYSTILSQGSATLSFSYEWDDSTGENFESTDQVWVKGRWTSPTSGAHELGASLDSGHSGSDAAIEIATANNPNTDFSGTFSASLTPWIEGAGMYYLEIGGKILANSNNEHGTWRFDDVQLLIQNTTNRYYLRKHFTITDLKDASRGIFNALSDDWAAVYLNGQMIDSEIGSHDGKYWNRRGKPISGSLFLEGDNVVAIQLTNKNKSAKFDFELITFNDSREKAMMVMSDGVATADASCPQSGTAEEEAIEAACEASEDFGITIYAVGYSNGADNATLQEIAKCGDGLFTHSNDITSLQNFYKEVASSIISLSTHSEALDIQGNAGASVLYGDSYIRLNYTPASDPVQFNEVSLLFKERDFKNCTFNVTIPSGVRVIDAKLTSYSSGHWTDFLSVNGNQAFNLSSFGPEYGILGDPFIVSIPPATLGSGNNTISIRTGDSAKNSTGCSFNNTFIYTAAIDASASYSEVVESADGCLWSVQREQGETTIAIPQGYGGSNRCSYNSSAISYDPTDGAQIAAFSLLQNLDFDSNGKINVDIASQGLQIESIKVSEVPSLWGPTIAEIRVWE